MTEPGAGEEPAPLVRVRLQVHYRVHSRQMLCVAGSCIPLGWSFLSIAKVPMSWAPGDMWSVEVELLPGAHLDYKFVVLEEQDWTQQVDGAAEGRVAYSYRAQPDASPPDVQHITRQMAIVAWQPGPNRHLTVPCEEELAGLRPGDRIDRTVGGDAASPSADAGWAASSRAALGRGRGPVAGTPASAGPFSGSGSSSNRPPRREEVAGVWEVLYLDEDGRPVLERRDIWGREEPPRRAVGRSAWPAQD